MDRFTVFCRTDAGDRALSDAQETKDRLFRSVLEAVDGFSTVGELSSRVGDSRSVQKTLQALESKGLIETLDARMSRVSEQESRWLNSEQPVAASAPASSGSAPKAPLEVDPSRFKRAVASGSKASLFDQLRAFLGNFRHELTSGGGDRGRRIRRAFAVTLILGIVLMVAFTSVVLGRQVSSLRGQVERSAASWIGEPVRIGSVGVGFHPWPAFVLKDIQVGEGGISRIEAAWGNPDWLNWVQGKPQHVSIGFEDAQIDSSLLLRVATLPPPSEPWRVKSIDVGNLSVRLGLFVGRGLEGSFSFGDEGLWTGARLVSSGKDGYILEAQVQDGHVQASAHAESWKLGSSQLENPMIVGELTSTGLKAGQFGAGWLSGAIKGVVDVDFSGTARLRGRMNLDGVLMEQVVALAGFPGVMEGRVSGPVTIEGSGENLLASLRWRGSYVIAEGSLLRIDLVEAMRRQGLAPISGGVTRFSRMEGGFAFEQGKPVSLDIRSLKAGALTASGRVSISGDGALKGGLRADVHTPVERVARVFSVDGRVVTPQLRPLGE